MELSVARPEDEALLLDLLNTTPVVDGERLDLLTDPGWLAEHHVDESQLTALTAARDALQAVVRGERSPSALQPFLDAVALTPVATEQGFDWQVAGADAATRAVLAWDSLRINSPGRLRPCANHECHLFLLDLH